MQKVIEYRHSFWNSFLVITHVIAGVYWSYALLSLLLVDTYVSIISLEFLFMASFVLLLLSQIIISFVFAYRIMRRNMRLTYIFMLIWHVVLLQNFIGLRMQNETAGGVVVSVMLFWHAIVIVFVASMFVVRLMRQYRG